MALVGEVGGGGGPPRGHTPLSVDISSRIGPLPPCSLPTAWLLLPGWADPCGDSSRAIIRYPSRGPPGLAAMRFPSSYWGVMQRGQGRRPYLSGTFQW